MQTVDIIFLDIDGVINVYDREENLKTYRDEYGHLFSKKCVARLRSIIEKTGAKIVISSVWRYGGLKKMQDMWKYRDLPGEVIGVTPSYRTISRSDWHDANPVNMKKVNTESVPRGLEVKMWLDKIRRMPEHNSKIKVKNYVIIDDDCDMLYEQRNRFIKCHNRIGINSQVEKKCLDMFGYTDPSELTDLKLPNGEVITAESFNAGLDETFKEMAEKDKKLETYFETKEFNKIYDKLHRYLKKHECIGDNSYAKKYLFSNVTNDEFMDFFDTVTHNETSYDTLNRDCGFPVETYLYGEIIFEMMFGQGTAYSCVLLESRKD